MRWVTRVSLAGMLVLASVFAGCVGAAVENSYKDAEPNRLAQSFVGGYEGTKQVSVPPGSSELRIAVNVEVSGGFTLQVYKPNGQLANQMSQGGVYSGKDDSWFTESSPAQGNWRIQVSTGGTGAFSVGAYVS